MTKAKVITEVQPAPTVLSFGQLPRSLTLSGLGHSTFAQAAVLIRLGYVFDTAKQPEIFPATGHAFLHLTLGAPEQHAIELAKEATEQALIEEARDFDQRVKEAAEQLIAEQAKAAAKAAAAAKIAAAEAALKELKAAAA